MGTDWKKKSWSSSLKLKKTDAELLFYHWYEYKSILRPVVGCLERKCCMTNHLVVVRLQITCRLWLGGAALEHTDTAALPLLPGIICHFLPAEQRDNTSLPPHENPRNPTLAGLVSHSATSGFLKTSPEKQRRKKVKWRLFLLVSGRAFCILIFYI